MMFKDCILPVSVAEYYAIYILIRVFMAFAASLFMWLILQVSRNHLISTGLLIIILAVEGILCNVIGDLNPAVIISVLLLCMVFSYDKSCNMLPLIHATPYGRHKLFYTKIAMSGILSVIICCVTYGIELYEVQNLYPLSCFEAPIQSLRCMEKFPLKISVGAFMAVVEAVHCIMLWSVMMVVYTLSTYMKSIKGMMISLIVLVVPEVLKMLGLTWCRYISVVQPVVYVEILQEQGFIWSIVSIAVMLVLGIVCLNLTRIRWCQDKRMVKHGGV